VFSFLGKLPPYKIFNPIFSWFPGARENGRGVYGDGLESLHVLEPVRYLAVSCRSLRQLAAKPGALFLVGRLTDSCLFRVGNLLRLHNDWTRLCGYLHALIKLNIKTLTTAYKSPYKTNTKNTPINLVTFVPIGYVKRLPFPH